MTELIWLNGEILPMSEARLNIEDRGFQFADGVYEVIRLYDGRPFTLREHLDAHGFADVEITMGMVCGATRLDLHNPWVDWTLASLQASAGQRATLLPNLAGSLPNDIFADQLGLPTLWVPHSYPACAQHAPNEHLLASVAREGLAVMMIMKEGDGFTTWMSPQFSAFLVKDKN